ncbi:Putative Cointegrate resolution protein S / recombinase (fragment) (plasmid) [Cupriavidus taiwanensis]
MGWFSAASADSIARYLAEHAQTLSINTLRQRLAAIAQWHVSQGFPDPNRAPHVRKVLKGIQALHPAQERRAKPLQLAQFEQLVVWLDAQIAAASMTGNDHHLQVLARNKALVLIGFWRGFRSDELSRLQIEHITVEPGRGMTIFLPHTKTDRNHAGTTHKAPALSRLCPVAAYVAWLAASGLAAGPVFRRIDRWDGSPKRGCKPAASCPCCASCSRMRGCCRRTATAATRCGAALPPGQTRTSGTSRC